MGNMGSNLESFPTPPLTLPVNAQAKKLKLNNKPEQRSFAALQLIWTTSEFMRTRWKI